MKRWFFLIITNLITASRLAVVIYLGYLAINDSVQFDLFFLFVLYGYLSDILDGYVARKFNAQSAFGAAFDPFCDKVLVCLIFTFLVLKYWPSAEINFYVKRTTEVLVAALFCLEISILSSSIFALFKKIEIWANIFGKLKMVFESVAISVWLLSLIAEEYLEIEVLPFTIIAIDLILILAIYYALRSAKSYWQVYQKFKKSLSP